MRPFALLVLFWGYAMAGTEWETIPFQEPIPAQCIAALGKRVWVGDAGGLRVSQDEGETWSTVASLPGNDTVAGLYSRRGILFAVRSGTFYRSADSGATWQKAGGDSFQSMGNRFESRGDSLFFFANRYPPYWVFLSVDDGRTWTFRDFSSESPDSSIMDPEPGLRVRLLFGTVSQSVDSGKTWTEMAYNQAVGPLVSIGAGNGWFYATSQTGFAIRGSIRTGEWRILEPAMRDPYLTDLAASGRNLCAVTAYGVWCSRDAGLHFGFLGANPFPDSHKDPFLYNIKRGMQLGVDDQSVYLGSLDESGPVYLATRSLEDSGTWRRLKYADADAAMYMVMAVREGLLAVFADTRSQSIAGSFRFISRNRGISFEQDSRYAINWAYPRTASVGKSMLAVTAGSTFYHCYLLLSPDSGSSWKSYLAPGHALNSLAVTDSFAYAVDTDSLKLRRFGFGDTTWASLPEAGKASAVAASDSILYIIGDGKIRKRNLHATPVALRNPSEKPPSRSPLPAQGRLVFPDGPRVRDALGKRAPTPSSP